jgi:uncharacterized protein (TIRG00374 family)
VAILAAAFLLRAVRWRALYTPGLRPPLRDVTRALFVGYLFNAILPLRAGEPARIGALNRRGGTSMAESTATVVVERAFDVLSLLLLLFVLIPWLPALAWTGGAIALAAALVVVLVAAVVVLAVGGERIAPALARLAGRLPGLTEERLAGPADNALRGFAALRRWRVAAVGLAWTTLSWLVVGVGYWLLAEAFHLNVSPTAGLLVVIAIGLAMILPSTPAAVGVFEGATVVALAGYGVDDSAALSYALVLHAISVVPFVVLAPFVLRAYRGTLRRSARPEPALASDNSPVRT